MQADPIRAPARAQDLTLRHRVLDYRTGDLERHYATLDLEEDTFINYGFVTRDVYELMHPRGRFQPWTRAQRTRVLEMLDFIRSRGSVHPRDLDRDFGHGTVTNYWGGSSKATTHLLDLMHYRGLLRIAGRQDGTRLYAARERDAAPVDARERTRRMDHLIDVLVHKYAPLSTRGLHVVVRRLRYAVPQWLPAIGPALERAKKRLAHAYADGRQWFWPADERIGDVPVPDGVRLLTPFDPVVWDRDRFEQLWGWQYRFEAYTPVAKRVRGYYALPLLWRDAMIGWANVTADENRLVADAGYVAGNRPRSPAFRRDLDEELERLRRFLGVPTPGRAAPA